MNTHFNFLKEASTREFSLYYDALKASSIAINKKGKSLWQQQNAYGRSPEAIVIAKEDASKKLYWAAGKILKLQRETGVKFLPAERVELTDSIRFNWCEDFYSKALQAIKALESERA